MACTFAYRVLFFCAALYSITLSTAVSDGKKAENGELHRRRAPKLNDEDYNTLVKILTSVPATRCYTDLNKHEKTLYSMAKYKHGLTVEVVSDPYRGLKLQRLTRNGLILLPPWEIPKCIDYFYKHTLGYGCTKLTDRISNHYYGISKNHVVKFLNQHPEHTKAHPQFKNKAPLQPISSGQYMERNQVDLVDMRKTSVEVNGKLYTYVLSVLDCYRRYLWLTPITNKHSTTVAKKLMKIYRRFGTPKHLQCDRGKEFFGAVEQMAKTYNINLIHSRPYHPQSQGKVERSHHSWKHKLETQEDLLKSVTGEDNWVGMLPYLENSYNNAQHEATKKSPYEVVFRMKSNIVVRLFGDGHANDKDTEGTNFGSENNGTVRDDIIINTENETVSERNELISEAENGEQEGVGMVSDSLISEVNRNVKKAEIAMVKRNLAKHPPNKYNPGEIVLVKSDVVGAGIKRKRLSLTKSSPFMAVVQERKGFLYTLSLLSGPVGKIVKVSVDKITSVSRQEELQRNMKTNCNRSKLYTNFQRLVQMVAKENSPKSGMEMLTRNAAIQGLQLDSDNAGGGNCMFYAIAQQLNKVFGISKSHREVRKEIVKFLSENPYLGATHLAAFVTSNTFLNGEGQPTTDNEKWKAYLESLSHDGTWGDHIVLMGAANLYHVSVSVISSLENSDPIVIDPEDCRPVATLLLGHIAEMHYVTLQAATQHTDTCSELSATLPYLEQSEETCNTQQQEVHLSSHRDERACCTCEQSNCKQSCSLVALCDHLLIYIFALATMHSDETLNSIALVCKRFYQLVRTQEFKDKLYVEWLKRVTDWSVKDRAYKEKYLYSRKSACHLVQCKHCNKEFPAASGWHRYPMGAYAFYDTDDDYCSEVCKESDADTRKDM